MRLESLKTGEFQEIANIRCGKPILLGTRNLHPDPLGKGDKRFPKMIVSCY